MKIENIRTVVNSNLPDSLKERTILHILADDKNVIPYLLIMLQTERESKEELILDSNAELSRAATVLQNPELADSSWVLEQIKLHYEKWKEVIKCNFNLK